MHAYIHRLPSYCECSVKSPICMYWRQFVSQSVNKEKGRTSLPQVSNRMDIVQHAAHDWPINDSVTESDSYRYAGTADVKGFVPPFSSVCCICMFFPNPTNVALLYCRGNMKIWDRACNWCTKCYDCEDDTCFVGIRPWGCCVCVCALESAIDPCWTSLVQ